MLIVDNCHLPESRSNDVTVNGRFVTVKKAYQLLANIIAAVAPPLPYVLVSRLFAGDSSVAKLLLLLAIPLLLIVCDVTGMSAVAGAPSVANPLLLLASLLILLV